LDVHNYHILDPPNPYSLIIYMYILVLLTKTTINFVAIIFFSQWEKYIFIKVSIIYYCFPVWLVHLAPVTVHQLHVGSSSLSSSLRQRCHSHLGHFPLKNQTLRKLVTSDLCFFGHSNNMWHSLVKLAQTPPVRKQF